ncbi:MAG: dethiobiotin synthase [Armatimonadota bacterium]
MKGIFISGTDTGVGKTLITGYLAGYLRRQGVNVITQKWVQTGCECPSEDLVIHRKLGGLEDDPELARLVNPYCFPLPASPHLAAPMAGATIESEVIENAYRQLARRFELVLIEGVGGALVPLRADLLTADLVARMKLRALVVVGNRLGCINHTLLTIEALHNRQIPIFGLVFNRMCTGEDERILQDNVHIIPALSGICSLGEMPYLTDLMLGAEAFEPIGEAILRRWRGE